MKDNGKKITCKDKAPMSGLMEEFIKEIGKKIKCMVKDITPGLMVECMMVIMLKIKNKDMELMCGQMVRNSKETGRMDNNTAKEFLLTLKAKLVRVPGKMVNEVNG